MSLLYVTENGAQINVQTNRVVVKYKDERTRSIPIETLESIMILGKAQLTTQCMEECMKRGIPVAFLSKGGRYFGRVISTGHSKAGLQRKQSALYDTDFSLNLGKRIMDAKIQNQIVVLKRYAVAKNSNISEEVRTMQFMLQNVTRAKTIAELNGYEGMAAKQYFAGLSKCIDENFSFHGRSRRPPLDPFNAMISLGYSILMNILYAEIENRGLNPYFGFVHRDDENHPTLASDLVEEWRAVLIDAVTMSLANGHEIGLSHFYYDTDAPGCYLTHDGLRIFLNKLEKKLQTEVRYLSYVDFATSFRRAISLQIKCLADAIEEADAALYQPIRIR